MRVLSQVPLVPALAILVGISLFSWLSFFVSRELAGLYEHPPAGAGRIIARLKNGECKDLNLRAVAGIIEGQHKMLQGAYRLQSIFVSLAKWTSLLLVVIGAVDMNALLKARRRGEAGP